MVSDSLLQNIKTRNAPRITATITNTMITHVTEEDIIMNMVTTITKRKKRKVIIIMNMLINIMEKRKMKICLHGRNRHWMLIQMLLLLEVIGKWRVPWMQPSRFLYNCTECRMNTYLIYLQFSLYSI